jgi:hypothetical protein
MNECTRSPTYVQKSIPSPIIDHRSSIIVVSFLSALDAKREINRRVLVLFFGEERPSSIRENFPKPSTWRPSSCHESRLQVCMLNLTISYFTAVQRTSRILLVAKETDRQSSVCANTRSQVKRGFSWTTKLYLSTSLLYRLTVNYTRFMSSLDICKFSVGNVHTGGSSPKLWRRSTQGAPQSLVATPLELYTIRLSRYLHDHPHD